MVIKINSAVVCGVDALAVDVEIETREGKPHFLIIGLGDNAIRESRDRIVTALKHSGFTLPGQILVNLAPAELRKEGSSFDLPIAIGILVASGQLSGRTLTSVGFYGELSLDGRLKPVKGVVALTIRALQSGFSKIVVPEENLSEAALIAGIEVVGVRSLPELIAYLQGRLRKDGLPAQRPPAPPPAKTFEDVCGQASAKRALCIAAAGLHNILLVGPPGCGKSMLAERFPSLLPSMTDSERLDAVRIHSVAGLPLSALLGGQRPFRAPHHVTSDVGLVGGGSTPRPGEISLAHNGVLFLDEFPEYRRSAIEALRAPLETGSVRIARAKGSVMFPARFQLVAAMNPCPCGRLGIKGARCGCSPQSIANYLKKLSQPILDRIDLHVELEAVALQDLTKAVRIQEREGVQRLIEQIRAAREWQCENSSRGSDQPASLNAMLDFGLSKAALRLLESAGSGALVSARSYLRIVRVARTIANLELSEEVREEHVAEAIGYRCLDRWSVGSRWERGITVACRPDPSF